MNNRNHRYSAGAEKGVKDKEKGRVGEVLSKDGWIASAPIVPLIMLGASEESFVGSGMQLEL